MSTSREEFVQKLAEQVRESGNTTWSGEWCFRPTDNGVAVYRRVEVLSDKKLNDDLREEFDYAEHDWDYDLLEILGSEVPSLVKQAFEDQEIVETGDWVICPDSREIHYVQLFTRVGTV